MHVLNGCKDVKKLATTQGTISDWLCCRDLHRTWQKSSDPWTKNSHMINSLKRSCVHFWVSPALQQPLMNCPIYVTGHGPSASARRLQDSGELCLLLKGTVLSLALLLVWCL